MNNIKDKFKDRLKDKLSQHEVGLKLKNKTNQESSVDENTLLDVIDFKLIDTLSEDKKIIKELKENSIKIFSIQTKAVIEMGEVFFNVYNLLSKSGSKEGIYTKWLELTGVSPRTALNYRKRYDIYNQVNEIGKNIIKKLPQKLIDEIYNKEDKNSILKAINSGEDRVSLETLLEDKRQVIEVITKEKKEMFKEIKISRYIEIFNELPVKYETLDEKRKKELEKHLKKIEEILK